MGASLLFPLYGTNAVAKLWQILFVLEERGSRGAKKARTANRQPVTIFDWNFDTGTGRLETFKNQKRKEGIWDFLFFPRTQMYGAEER